jgi:deazaflavin-dependent oxidoreductase (nitroreductase family)
VDAAEGERADVAFGGGSRHLGWHANLMAHPEQATIELPGEQPVPVTPEQLRGAELDAAWEHIVAVQPRYAKYQRKSERRYPVIRLTAH